MKTLLAILKLLGIITVNALPFILIGMWWGEHLEALRFLVMLIGGMCGFMWASHFCNQKWKQNYNQLVEDYNSLAKRHNEAIKQIMDQHRQDVQQTMEFIEEYFDNSPITNYVYKIKDDGSIKMSIGDDKNMVDIKWDIIRSEGIVAALECARAEWMNLQNQKEE